MKLMIEKNEADTGEYDLLMLGSDGVWEWLRTCESRKHALACMKEEYRENAATANAERQIWGSQQWAETRGDDLGESPDY
jgi:serine/threonine protein phosphatase PrpC